METDSDESCSWPELCSTVAPQQSPLPDGLVGFPVSPPPRLAEAQAGAGFASPGGFLRAAASSPCSGRRQGAGGRAQPPF